MADKNTPSSDQAGSAAEETTAVTDLVAQIQGDNDTIRAKAWRYAYVAGPDAIRPLAALVTGTELEVGRAARRAMWKIVRHSGRPGADGPRTRTVAELLTLLDDGQPRAVRAEVIWMLSEIGGDESVAPLSRLLSTPELREDARMALQRIPGDRSLAALRSALAAASDDFKLNVAQSLRKRGVHVPGLPCAKLTPTKSTEVEPAGR